MKLLLLAIGGLVMSACSVFGDEGVEIAQYNILSQDGQIEIRNYEELVLVSTEMSGDIDDDQGSPFNKLFRYISGDNTGSQEIAMTAPVIMDREGKGEKIAMTAPVFMDRDGDSGKMSFVLPSSFDYETAPRPTNPDVKLEKIENMQVAVIRFSGFLSEENVQKHRKILEEWIGRSDYVPTGPYKTAGYNAPWTLPMARRNEVLIPVAKE